MIVGRVRRTLRERGLLEGGEGVLVACSGGADSGAMLHVLAHLAEALRLRVESATVDHRLRPDADSDVAVARAQAARAGVPMHVLTVTVSGEGGVQAAARRARYAALREVMEGRGLARLAVGHTMDDQAETALGRVLRGAGIRGLGGVQPSRADGVIRPMIDCRRADLRDWVVRQGWPFVDDPSNDDLRFARVRLRQRVLPRLQEEDPQVIPHLGRLADEARALTAWLERAATEARRDVAAGGGLRREALALHPEPVRREVLRQWLGRAARSHLEALDRLVVEGKGEVRIQGPRIVFADDSGVLRIDSTSGRTG
jgi:tRNA(Ile)-lysidine synthase